MSDSKRSHTPLLLLGVAIAGLALVYEFLWMARHPEGEAMAFVVNRLGLDVALSPMTYELFTLVSLAVASACVAVAWLVARRALSPDGGARIWAVGLAGLALLVFATPLHYVFNWAHGGLHEEAFFSAAWSRRQFLKEMLAANTRLLWLAAFLALGGWLLVTRLRWPSALLAQPLARIERLPRWLLVGASAVVMVVLAAGFSCLVLECEPRHPDAGIYFLQAKTFAAGRVTSPLLGHRDFFDMSRCPVPAGATLAFVGERWFSVALPFAPLCYAVGVVVGVPWLVPPLLGGLLVVSVYVLSREVFGASAALVAAPLAAASPFLIFMSGEYLTHVPGAICGALFMAGALRAMGRGSGLAAALAGLCIGLFAATRPVTAAGFSVPTAVAWVVWLIRRPRQAWKPTLTFAAALAVPAIGILAYNAATTGSATTFGYQLSLADWNPVPESMGTPGWRWTPLLGLDNVTKSLYWLDRGVLRWPLPWLGVVAATLALLGPRREPGRRVGPLLVALTVLSLTLAYAPWRYALLSLGGPRFVFEVAPLTIVLAAGALVMLHERLVAAGIAAERVIAVLAAAVLLCVAYGIPDPLRRDARGFRKDARQHLTFFRRIEDQAERPAVVFVPIEASGKATALFYLLVGRNDPTLSGPIVYARDLGPRNELLAADLPGRHYYRWHTTDRRLEPLTLGSVTQGPPRD